MIQLPKVSHFTLTNYSLILFAIFIHEPIGRLFKLKGVITRALSGLGLSALIVACLANVCAGLIRPFIFLAIATGTLLTARDWRRAAEGFSSTTARIYIQLATVALASFLLNDPSSVFLRSSEGDGHTLIQFNRHYSYFSSLSTEMLNADYLSRLRIANLYPQQWSAYHFFNASTLAVAQGLLPHPGLFSYFSAQACLMTLILLSFGEQMLLAFTPSKKTLVTYLCWLIVGFTIFHHPLTWSLGTSGAYSVFAMVQLLFSLNAAQNSHVALYSLLLGASAIRLAPLGVLSIAGLYTIYLKWRLRDFLIIPWRIHWPLGLIALVFSIYNVLTVTSGSRVNAFISAHWASGVFSDEWLSPLASYKFFGYLSSIVSGTAALPGYNVNGEFSRLTENAHLQGLLIAFLTLLPLALLYEAGILSPLQRPKKLALPLVLAGSAYLAIIFHLDRGVFKLNLIASPYFFFGALFIRKVFLAHHDRQSRAAGDALRFLLLLFGGTLTYLYTGTAEGIKAPAAMVVFDIGLWGLLGLYAQTANARQVRWIAGAFLAHLLFFDVRAGSALQLRHSENHDAVVDISPLLAANFRREDYLGPDGVATFDFQDALMCDVYSAALGVRLPFNPHHDSFMNWRFLPASPATTR